MIVLTLDSKQGLSLRRRTIRNKPVRIGIISRTVWQSREVSLPRHSIKAFNNASDLGNRECEKFNISTKTKQQNVCTECISIHILYLT